MASSLLLKLGSIFLSKQRCCAFLILLLDMRTGIGEKSYRIDSRLAFQGFQYMPVCRFSCSVLDAFQERLSMLY